MILKMNINMTDITEKTENGELVTNRDQLVVVDNIESLIKVIRGQQVMLDKDLATLYGVETRTLNQAVKRNIQRFPADFRFQLTMEECSKSQIVTLNAGRFPSLSLPIPPYPDLTTLTLSGTGASVARMRACNPAEPRILWD